jgi:hypothetical protein
MTQNTKLTTDKSVKKRKRFKIPYVKVTLQQDKSVYKNNSKLYENTTHK